ncbi:hypothetical protein LINGRAHAP2_LOCUS20087 [Linum grandiflorum]
MWAPYVDEYEGDSPERDYRMVAPLICFRCIMLHRPDCVLHPFRMEQPISRTEMQQGEVMSLLGLTQMSELLIFQTMDQYLA